MRHLIVVLAFCLALISISCDNVIRSFAGLSEGCAVSDIGLTAPSGVTVPFPGAEPLCVYKPFTDRYQTVDRNFSAALLAETSPKRGYAGLVLQVGHNPAPVYDIAVQMASTPGLSDAVVSVWTSKYGPDLDVEVGSAILHPGQVVRLRNTRRTEASSTFIARLVVKAVYERPPIDEESRRVLVTSTTGFEMRIGS